LAKLPGIFIPQLVIKTNRSIWRGMGPFD